MASAVTIGYIVGPQACTRRCAVIGSATSTTTGSSREAAEFGVQREHGPRDRGVVAAVLGQHDDAAGFPDARDREIGPYARISETVDNARVVQVGHRIHDRPS